MFTLIVLACTLGTTDCEPRVVAGDFPEKKACISLGAHSIIPAYALNHPDVKVQRWTCTDSPAYLLYRFEA